MRARAILAAWLLALAPATARPPADDWRRLITIHDNDRLKTWRAHFVQAVAEARADGAGPRIDAAGALLRPDAFLDTPHPPDGDYRCRLYVLGKKSAPYQTFPDSHTFLVHPPAHCVVHGATFAMREGPERPGGRLYPYDEARLLLLGGLAVGDEIGTVRYGRDSDRDLIGLLQRYGDRRWRLLLPEPHWQGLMDVVDIAPE